MYTLYKKSSVQDDLTIKSSNVMCCAETDRIIAVFYNDYDLEEVLDQQQELKALGGLRTQPT